MPEPGLDLIDQDIRRQSSVLREGIPALRRAADSLAADLSTPTRVYLVGCGDSLDEGFASRFVWEPMVGVPVEAVPAMTFASRMIDIVPDGSLVIALSQSGRVSRVVEAVRVARSRGLATVAITADAGSPLATEPSDLTWTIDFKKLGAVPGTTSHLMGALALYELGCAIASDAKVAEKLRSEIDLMSDLVEQATAIARPIAEMHAQAFLRESPVLALGYGPCLSTARFTIRKFLEFTQLFSVWQETEEYAHDEYSLVDARFRVLQFAPPDRGHARNVEIAHYLRRLDATLGIVTDSEIADSYREAANVVYPLPPMPASLAPLVYAVPGQVLSLEVARRVGGSLYGMADLIHAEDGDPQIYDSEIVVV